MMRVVGSGRFVIAAGITALLATACGGQSNTGDADTTELTIEAGDFEFRPSKWQVAADSEVTVSLANQGLNVHEWVILTLGTEISSETDFNEDGVEVEIALVPAGETHSTTFNLPAGSYQVICALPGHFDAGMEGSLTVGP